jgi:endonuclease/exonuclease/phosphatase family metal-dependent hydrolase
MIALQEVDSREHRGLELLDHLAEETGLQAIPGPTLLRHTGHYGNAFLTRLHIREVRRLDLSFLNHEPRGAIDADLECHPLMLQVVVTHLALKPAERRFQVQHLLDRVSSAHCALLGDSMNSFSGDAHCAGSKRFSGGRPPLEPFPLAFHFFRSIGSGSVPRKL